MYTHTHTYVRARTLLTTPPFPPPTPRVCAAIGAKRRNYLHNKTALVFNYSIITPISVPASIFPPSHEKFTEVR